MAAPLIRLADRLRLTTDKPAFDPISMDDSNAVVMQGILSKVTGALLAGAPVIVGDPVSEYYYAQSDKEHWEIKTDFPLLIPPFKRFWVEWCQPSLIRSKVYGITKPESSSFTMTGTLVTVGTPSEMLAEWGVFPAQRDDYARLVADADWVWRFQPVAMVAGQVAALFGKPEIFGVPAADYWFATTLAGAVTNFVCTTTSNAPAITGGSYVELVGKEAPVFTHPALLTMTFLNLKNGTMTPAELHAPPKFARNYAKRKGQELVRYHTVLVDPSRTTKPSVGGAGTGRGMPLSLVRGHIVTYRDEPGRRLFGRYSGTYFRPPHVRGTAKEGVSLHDYQVVAPKERVNGTALER
jgi:hypothetical protein